MHSVYSFFFCSYLYLCGYKCALGVYYLALSDFENLFTKWRKKMLSLELCVLATFAMKVLEISERSTTIMLAVFSKLSYPYLLAMAAVVVEIAENKQKKHILMILAIDIKWKKKKQQSKTIKNFQTDMHIVQLGKIFHHKIYEV